MPFLSFLRFRYVHPFRINIYYHTATTVHCRGKWSSSSFMLIKLRRFPRRHLELLGQLAVAALSRSLSLLLANCYTTLFPSAPKRAALPLLLLLLFSLLLLYSYFDQGAFFCMLSLWVCVVVCFVRQLLAAVAVAATAPFVLSLYLTRSLSLFAP